MKRGIIAIVTLAAVMLLTATQDTTLEPFFNFAVTEDDPIACVFYMNAPVNGFDMGIVTESLNAYKVRWRGIRNMSGQS